MNLEEKLNSVNKSIQNTNETTTGRVVSIPIDKIKSNPDNFYDDNYDIENLSESIKEVGLLTPITITEDYLVISGHRRVNACRLANLKSIDAIIDNSNENIDIKLIEANRHRVKTEFEINKEIKKLEQHYISLKAKNLSPKGRIRSLVANDLGISEATVARRLSSMKKTDDESVEREVSLLEKDIKTLTNKCKKILDNVDKDKYNIDEESYTMINNVLMLLKDKKLNFNEVDDNQLSLDDMNN